MKRLGSTSVGDMILFSAAGVVFRRHQILAGAKRERSVASIQVEARETGASAFVRRMPSTSAAFAAGAAAAAALYCAYQFVKNKKPSSIKVTYFDIKATPGEKLRLALVLTVGEAGFTDERIPGSKWAEVKEARKPKYGQMPIVTLDGKEYFQSGAMLRYFGSALGDGSLYPTHDQAACMKIEEMLGLADDFQRAWTPGLYSGMNP